MGRRLDNPVRREHYWYKAFILGLLLAVGLFVPYMIMDHGYFLYYGDFNVQQVPFYQMVHDAVRNGEWGWSYTTDLGSSLIGSYTFYLLGSPFFWLTIPFPSEAVPYLMGPLLILKFGCASLTSYIYLRRYTRHKGVAVLGGIMYAFSGFSVYNVFFNHFHEAIITFPLLLAAIDEYMDNKRRGVVALAVFASCIVNYYFFVGMVMFVIIYWFIRMFMSCWRINLREVLALGFEVIIGFAGTSVLLLPTILFVTQNPRISELAEGWNALVYSSEQRYLHILSSLFFPPDIPARPNFTPDSNSKWASIAAWLPLFGMTGVIGFLQSRSKGWLKKLLPFLLLCTMVPVLNSIFQMFIISYYARWFYMLELMMILATVVAIENTNTNWHRAVTWSAGFTVAIAVGIGLMPTASEDETGETVTTYGLENYPDRFWVYVAIAMLSLALVTLLVRLIKNNKRQFIIRAGVCLSVVAVLYSSYIIGLGKTHSYDVDDYIIPYALNGGEDLNLDDLQSVRSDFYETMDNIGMFWQIPNIQAFQSLVPGSLYSFYPSVGVTRDVASRPDAEYYGLRGLLSVKYVFDYADDSESFANDEGQTRMPGYSYLDTQNGYDIYLNEYYISYGFYFDSYITEEQYYECDESDRHLLLLKALVLTDEQAEEYGDLMTHIEDISTLTYDSDQYKLDCLELQGNTCSSFEYGTDSFTATITVDEDEDKLVFFSVPYESGWSATVNGAEVEIEQVDVGFMAVRVEGGTTSEIVFTYETPGLKAGIIITIVCIILYAVYMIISAKKGLVKPRPKIKKSYSVSAFGSADALGEKYRNLSLGSHPMSKRKAVPPQLTANESGGKQQSDITPEEELPDTDAETATAQQDGITGRLPTSGMVDKVLDSRQEKQTADDKPSGVRERIVLESSSESGADTAEGESEEVSNNSGSADVESDTPETESTENSAEKETSPKTDNDTQSSSDDN